MASGVRYLTALALAAGVACRPAADSPAPGGFVVAGAVVYDGTGAPGRIADVRVVGDRIDAVGDLRPGPSMPMIDGTDLALAPGFIDTHSHHDRGLFDARAALAAVSQGITTIVVGQDGGSPFPLAEYYARLDSTPAAVNVAAFSGHNTLRRQILGDTFRRLATPAEVEQMATLLQADLDAGALGLSTGLEYDPGIYASTEEVMALARVAARAGTRYISHLRSEDRHLSAAIDEILAIGTEAGLPVQVTHMKLARRGLWGEAAAFLARLDSARAAGIDVTADVYPYEYWQSTMTVLLPERDFEDRSAFAFALDELAPPDGIILTRYEPNRAYVGRSLADIATERREDPVTTYMALVAESQAFAHETGRSAESIMGRSMHPDDIATLLAWPHTNISTDGTLDGRHPRGFGAFPRVFRQYWRESGSLALETVVHKASGLSADHMGLPDRGTIAPGAFADLVLFDPDRISDRATIDNPHATADGIRQVWVNGKSVWLDGAPTGAYPGHVVRRP